MRVTADDSPTIVRFLSQARLASLIGLTGSQTEAIELHQETLRVGSGLMNVIATVEIAVRNSVGENLALYFSVDHWLTQTPVHFKWREPERKKIEQALDSARRAEYSKLSQAGKADLDVLAYPGGRPPNTSHLKRAKDRRKRIDVPEGAVIAELMLYFWKRLYGPEYDQTLWRETLKRTFPCKKLRRADIAIQLEKIYQARNRLAHHEPVLRKRFEDAVAAIRFVVEHLETASPTPDTPLASLTKVDLLEVSQRATTLHAKLEAYRQV